MQRLIRPPSNSTQVCRSLPIPTSASLIGDYQFSQSSPLQDSYWDFTSKVRRTSTFQSLPRGLWPCRHMSTTSQRMSSYGPECELVIFMYVAMNRNVGPRPKD